MKRKKMIRDVFNDPKKKVLSLRPRLWSDILHEVYVSHRPYIFFGLAILLFSASFSVYKSVTRADVALLNPTACLGGWENPSHAEGAPDVADQDVASDFNASNSAVLEQNTYAELFCGAFSGSIPVNSSPKKIVLTLSWDAGDLSSGTSSLDASASDTNSAVSAGDDIAGSNFASSTGDILDASDSATTTFTLTDSTSSDADSEASASSSGDIVNDTVDTSDEASATDATSPESSTTSTPDDASGSPSSFLDLFVHQAFADDALPTSTPDDSSDASDASSSVPTVAASSTASSSASTSDDVAASPTSTISAAAATPAVTDDFLEVEYTLDGTHWQTLGTIDRAHMRYASFEIPLGVTPDWDDVSKIQIGVKDIPSIDPTPTVFLDAMTLQVVYGTVDDASFVSKSGLYISNVSALSQDLDLQVRNNDEQEQELVITGSSSPFGGLAIYNASSSNLVLDTFIGDNSYAIQPHSFGVGDYVVIETSDPDNCSDSSLDACLNSPDFEATAQFSVTASSSHE